MKDFNKEIQLLAQKVLGSSYSFNKYDVKKSLNDINDMKVEIVKLFENVVLFEKELLDTLEKEGKAGQVVEVHENERVEGEEVLKKGGHIFRKVEAFGEVKEDINTQLSRMNSHKTINDASNKELKFGLNDKIAFISYLFGGDENVFNQVVIYLNSMTQGKDALKFINENIKPQFGGWEGREEYADRFVNTVMKKFE